MIKENDLKRNYEDLANAIVMQACVDYAETLDKDSYENKIKRESIEDFFHSIMFGMITDIDPDELIKELKKNRNKTFFYIVNEMGLLA